MPSVDFSIVIPARNEAACVAELMARCFAVGDTLGRPFEIVLVDDASTDGMSEKLDPPPRPELRVIRLPSRVGHLSAIRCGLAEAQGRWVAVIDGDLQDPPEVLPELLSRARQTPGAAVFAIKKRRHDPYPFMVAQWIFHRLQYWFARYPIILGSSTCCCLPQDVARSVAAVPVSTGNIAAIVSALGVSAERVSYERAARRGGRSRLGSLGHAGQALYAWALTGALSRVTGFVAILGLVVMLAIRSDGFSSVAIVPVSILLAAPFLAALQFESTLRQRLPSNLAPAREPGQAAVPHSDTAAHR